MVESSGPRGPTPYPLIGGFMDRPLAVPESEDQILMLALPVTYQPSDLDKRLNLSVPQFSHLPKGSDALISKDKREDTVFKCNV